MKHNVIHVIEHYNKKIKFNYRLQSKVGVKYKKEDIL